MAKQRRRTLNKRDREEVRKKTPNACHLCGDQLSGMLFADHVVPHLRGGSDGVENRLPVCFECNRLRWSYEPDVIRRTLRLGIWAMAEIRGDTPLGRLLVAMEERRIRQNEKKQMNDTLEPRGTASPPLVP